MKNDEKFEKELTYQLKIDMTNLLNVDPNIRNSQKFTH